jgi:CHAD domain-containing protein
MTAASRRTFDAQRKDLQFWMDQVLEEHAKLGRALSAEPVHDLRVALRRCILIAEVMRGLDPQGHWKPMSRAAKGVFRNLGALRDTQVLLGWVERLGPPGEASTLKLAAELKAEKERNQASAQEAVRDFNKKKWRNWSTELSPRFRHVVASRAACDSLILEIWDSVRELHRRAQKSRSRLAYHRLRVQLKKFRYAVENFLPAAYAAWESDLKFLQDLLGEVHDLDLLSQEVVRKDLLSGEDSRGWWRNKLDEERAARLQQYRAKTAGKSSPLWIWREGLPAERDVRAAGLAKLGEWAYFATPDFPQARRIAKFSLQLYDGFASCGLIPDDSGYEGRSILHAAALLQEVGRIRKNKAHHKESYRIIRSIATPAGWSKRDLELAALVARFHRGAMPGPDHKVMKAYSIPLRQSLLLQSALLRLANAFSAKPYRAVRRLQVENCSGVILVRAEGYAGMDPPAPKLSAAKHLVEFACHRPVHILPPGGRIPSPHLVQPATRTDAA